MKKQMLSDYVRLLRIENEELRQLKAQNLTLQFQKQKWLEEYRKLSGLSDSLIDAMKCHIAQLSIKGSQQQQGIIKDMDETLLQQNDVIEELHAEIVRRKDDVNSMSTEIEEKNQAIIKLQEMIDKKNAENSEITATANDLRAKLADLKKDIGQRDLKIKALNEEIIQASMNLPIPLIVPEKTEESTPAIEPSSKKEAKKMLADAKNKLCNEKYKVKDTDKGLAATKPGTRKIEVTNGPLPGSAMYIVCGIKYYDFKSALKASAHGTKALKKEAGEAV